MSRKNHKHARTTGEIPEHPSPPPPAPPTAPPGPENTRNYWFIGALVFVLIAPFASILLFPGDRVLGNERCDNPSAYYFYAHYMGQCWRQGMVPLWNPYIMLGLPFLGDGEASVFHPLSFLFALMRTQLAINWLIALSFILTGLLFYGYLRALGLGRPASWCGAITWSFSNAMISRIFAGHLNILLTFISIPMIMMFWEQFRARGGLARLAGVAVAYALAILAWYPQIIYIFSLFFLLYVLTQSFLAVSGGRSTLALEARAILLLGFAVLLGLGLGSIQLFPSMDFISRSFRQKATLYFCGIFSFPTENFITLVAPDLFGTHIWKDPVYVGRNFFWEMWLYLGILPLMLAAAGAWVAPRGRRIALLVCAAVFLVLGLGRNTPLFPLIYDYVPLFDILRGSSKNTLVTLFCLVTLSAYGFEGLFTETDPARRRRLLRLALGGASVMFAAALLVWLFLVRGSQWQHYVNWVMNSGDRFESPEADAALLASSAANASRALGRSMILIALAAALLIGLRAPRWRKALFPAAALLVLVDLLGVFLPLMRTFERSLTQVPLELDESVGDFPYPPRILNPNPMPNVAMKSGYSSPFGYSCNTLRRYNEFISLVQELDPADSQASSKFVKITPYYKLLAFDAVAVDPPKVPANTQPIGHLGKRVLVPIEHFFEKLPRAFLAASPRYFLQRADALGYVFARDTDVLGSPSIERPSGGVAGRPLEPDETVRFVTFKPQRVVLDVHANYPREVIQCGMFERNWTARVNGQAEIVQPANYIYRAVRVPAGDSRVVFEYKPAAFYRGAAVSACSLVLLLALLILGRFRPRNLRLFRALPDWILTTRPRGQMSPAGFRRGFPLPHNQCPVFRIFVVDRRGDFINYRGNEAL